MKRARFIRVGAIRVSAICGVTALVATSISFVADAQPKGAPARAVNAPAPVAYTQAMVGWHAPAPGKKPPSDANGRPMLALTSINRNEHLEIPALTANGSFSTRDLDRIAHLLRAATGDTHPIEPRIVDIVYRIQTHFAAQELRIVSGYRTPKARSNSNHGKGRAIDFIVPGTPDAEVAKFAREIGFVGVGIYPTSQFLHVDVRPRSYFWVDNSGPGRRNRERGILGDLAAWSDQQATARGERGIAPFIVGSDVDAAVRARTAAASQGHSVDDDEDDGEETGGG